MSESRDFNYLAYLEQSVRDGAKQVAEHLRRVADEVEREAERSKIERLAGDVTHTVMWGLANANLDTVAQRHADLLAARDAAQTD
ncbi:hypothetical protein SEA_KUDEFRE_137 [Gordonia phage Kudefre]|uniref:Uncharacterized protein n=1 Tax=Gordonia phage Kudefre TaxID=2885975 RepID=A0AAE9C2F9_9CAUD|nr:hypothetical protein L3Y24_gp106 [Gordonia phage Kudefre]UDL15353.1 hypothetical protein SEA_KUDEFRE_137 [Gordonia phage Kudefre]